MNSRELRLKSRMEARNRTPDDQIVTAEDLQHLDEYVRNLDEAIDLIKAEITSISEGRLAVVNALYERKAELLKWLELRAPIVEPFLKQDVSRKRDLPNKLATLKKVLEEDRELLKRMAGVAASIVREIERSINRNSLDGIYGKSGEKLSTTKKAKRNLDHEI